MPGNRLSKETSPYLRQHKDNPVDWRPWDTHALVEARQAEKPILLSIGYAACHWCHVMAHESFEDPSIAAFINEHFIPIKVDREERPEIDWIYQHALALTGVPGGWPLTMFLTPQGAPFWGGTYFPPQSRYGRPGFDQVLRGVIQSYSEHGDRITHNVQALRTGLQSIITTNPGLFPSREAERQSALRILGAIDWQYGGLTGAPKFPQAPLFAFLWRQSLEHQGSKNPNLKTAPKPDYPGDSGVNQQRNTREYSPSENQHLQDAVLLTLRMMCQGGIYDHLGGGFARYSTDAIWLVPHFEKMLYDNALILEWLTEAWRHTQDPLFEKRIHETIDWLRREMQAEAHGFAASLDADSPVSDDLEETSRTHTMQKKSQEKEGAYYIWRADEIDTILRKNSRLFKDIYGVTEEGNWEGCSILNRLNSKKHPTQKEENILSSCKSLLLSERSCRQPPQRDDKVLADWNGMIIASLARIAMVFDDDTVLEMASSAYIGVRDALSAGGAGSMQYHRLQHVLCKGQASHPPVLEDYAHMARAALMLSETIGGEMIEHINLLKDAEQWVSVMNTDYWDAGNGGYYMVAPRDDLILRPKTAADQATPSGNAVACEVLARLYLLTGQENYRERAEAILAAFAGSATARPTEHCALFNARAWLEKPLQIILIGSETDPKAKIFRHALRQRSLPTAMVLQYTADDTDALPPNHPAKGKTALNKQATAYICQGPVCGPPVITKNALLDALDTYQFSNRSV